MSRKKAAQHLHRKAFLKKKQDELRKKHSARREKVREARKKAIKKIRITKYGKPRVLMVADVEGWGAWTRGRYIKKHLSDEFHFDMVTIQEFQDCKDIWHDEYDVYYMLLHILMRYPFVQELARKKRTLATVTSGQLLKPGWGRNQAAQIKVFKTMMRNVDTLIVNNLLVKPFTEKHFTGSRVRYGPRGVDPDVFKFINYPMDEIFTVNYVGKPVAQKGLEKYIRPLCKSVNARLLVNSRNWENALSERDMAKFYNRGNAYIVASTIDGTPNPALEAASCGRSIISNHIGNMPEFIEDGVNGFLIPFEIKAYAEKLQFLMDNRKVAREMGQNARETVLKEWTWDKILNRYQRAILQEVVK